MATCPICRNYDGSPASVEAHISGNRDENHQGEWGSAWRDEITGPFEDVEVDDDPSGNDGSSDVSTSDVDGEELRDDSGSEGSSHDDVEMGSLFATDGSDVADQAGTEIDPATALLVATALFALVVIVGAVLSDDDDAGEPAESDQEESADETDEPDVSLLG